MVCIVGVWEGVVMDYFIPTTEEVRAQWGYNYPDYDNRPEQFDRWLIEVETKARQAEREHLIEGLRMIVDYALQPSEFRKGYEQAMIDIKQDALPNAPRFIITGEETK